MDAERSDHRLPRTVAICMVLGLISAYGLGVAASVFSKHAAFAKAGTKGFTVEREPGYYLQYQHAGNAISDQWALIPRPFDKTYPVTTAPSWVPKFDTKSYLFQEACAFGWPLPTVASYSCWNPWDNSSAARTDQGLIRLKPLKPNGQNMTTLTFAPIWSGLFWSSTVHAATWALILIAFPTLRRHLRLGRGHCPRCNYNLVANFLSGCPECGWNRASMPLPTTAS